MISHCLWGSALFCYISLSFSDLNILTVQIYDLHDNPATCVVTLESWLQMIQLRSGNQKNEQTKWN